MRRLVISATSVFLECAKAVHGLGTALRRALLESLGVWAAVTVVGNIGRNLVDPAAPVLVVIRVVEALGIRSPSTNTVHRLAALVLGTVHLAIRVRASLAAQVSRRGHLVGAAALVLVARSNMLTATIRSPLALAVHGLAAARLGALLESILVRASKAVVQGNLRNLVETAALVLMILLVVVARSIRLPCSDAVNRLSALLSSALLEVI